LVNDFTVGLIVYWHGYLIATQCIPVLLAHANQLPLLRSQQVFGHKSDLGKQCKYFCIEELLLEQ